MKGRTGRPAGKQGAELLDVARALFLAHGFAGSTMGDVAALAGVSKASLYGEHPSKSSLFEAVVTDWSRRGRNAMRPHLDALEASTDIEQGLRQFASVLSAAVLSDEVAGMRRLVAAEAHQFPDVAALYLTTSWQTNIHALAETLSALTARGLLDADDPATAAEDLVWLTVGRDLNAATITARSPSPPNQVQICAAVSTFLARYGSTTS